ncbi:hypothetical protein G9A89_005524 [Geosiphon pyriformis]|nr:hypothetical protein G9A89_005524 [Geosiphon pyriformis]
MKITAKVSGSSGGFKSVLPRKKRRNSVLEDGSNSKTGDTTKSESIDIEEKCLVEETSFDYEDINKPLGKINFLPNSNDNDVLLDAPLKSFALDIELDKIIGKSSQKKLQVVRKLFSKINGFERASIPSKFAEIIRAMFIFELSLAQATKKAEEAKILVNTNLKKSSGHSDQTVLLKKISVGTSTEAVYTALSEFGIIKSIKIQLVELWQKAVSILIRKDVVHVAKFDTNTHNIWNYVTSVARCAAVCFDFAESLNAVMKTTLVLKETSLHWSCLVLAECAGYEKLGYTLLACSIGKKKDVSFCVSLQKTLSNFDKSRLAAIYAKCSAPIACSVSFMLLKLNDRFATLKHSLISLTKCVDKLMLAVGNLLSQNQEADIVISEGSGVVTGGETVTERVIFDPLVVKKMEETLNNLSIIIMGFSAKMDNTGLVFTTSQNNIVCWHKDMNNLISIFTETKLKGKVCPWIANKFGDVCVFISGLNSGHLESGVAMVIDNFLNKLSVSILEFYAGAFSAVQFSQAGNINTLIVKATNESSFVVLGGNFNKDNSHKYVSFKKCFSLGLVNSLVGSLVAKLSMWKNSRGIVKTIDYIFVSPNLVNVILCCDVLDVSEHFDTDHHAVSVSMSLGGLLNVQLNSLCKQTNRDYEFKDAMMANTAMFSDEFVTSKEHSDLNAMFHKLEVLVSRLAKAFHEIKFDRFALVSSGVDFGHIYSAFFDVRKSYHVSKLAESLHTKELDIRSTIEKQMKSFAINKGHTIHSVLEYSF